MMGKAAIGDVAGLYGATVGGRDTAKDKGVIICI